MHSYKRTGKNIRVGRVRGELRNLTSIIGKIIAEPRDLPDLRGIDVYGETLPLNGIAGGDHLIFVDFKKRYDLDAWAKYNKSQGRYGVAANLLRNKSRAGIFITDVAGHELTDALLNVGIHQAFLLGAAYELRNYGEITTVLFERLNDRLFNSTQLSKFTSAIYGEIYDYGKFRFISAGHPAPIVFSNKYDSITALDAGRYETNGTLGTLPSKPHPNHEIVNDFSAYHDEFQVHEINLLGSGDILLLYTDGLTEHGNPNNLFCPGQLETTLRRTKHLTARQIFGAIKDDLMSFAEPQDDITYVVIKKL